MAARRALRDRAVLRALLLNMFQERQDHRHVQLLDLQLGRLRPKPLPGEGDQQLEAVGVGFAGVRTGAAIAGQVLAKEGCKRWGERRHCASPRCSASPASAMWVISTGLAWRYQ